MSEATFYEQLDQPGIHCKRWDSGVIYPVHCHEAVEIVYCRRGEVHYLADGREYILTAGDVAVAFPYVGHGFPPGSTADAVFEILFVPAVLFDGATRAYYTDIPECARIAAGELEPMTREVLEHTADCCRAEDTVLAELYGRILLECLARQMTLSSDCSRDPHSRLLGRELIRYCNEHFAEPLSLDTVAQALGVSRYTLSKFLRRDLHTGFYDLLNGYRLRQVCRRLTETEDTVTAVAQECGFESVSTFNRVFREQTGMSPTGYRRRFSGNG